MSVLTPPKVLLAWTATALGSSFGGYRIYRRPPRLPAPAWELIIQISPPASGLTAATMEANFTKAIDFEAGWAGVTGLAGTIGQWASGWDYALTVINATTGVESGKTSIDALNVVASDANPWITCNAAPFLNFPLEQAYAKATDDDPVIDYRIAGRDELVTRTRLELAARRYAVTWDDLTYLGEDALTVRGWRGAAASGRQVALLLPLGDRILGTCRGATADHTADLTLAGSGTFTETARSSALAGANSWPAIGPKLSGTAITVADNSLLDPASSAFTVLVAAPFANAAASRYALSKGNLGAGQGYALRTTGNANELQGIVTGATTSATLSEVNAAWFDGNVHVAILSSTGAAQKLYRDGIQRASSSTAHGAVANAIALSLGGNNGGATTPMTLAPLVAFAVWLRQLSDDEALAASYYLLGYPGWRMPAGASIFYDFRDARTWAGSDTAGAALADLSGNGLDTTATLTPMGQPFDLTETDVFG